MQKGAIILCGGKSTRMGRDKATLPFGPETMLQRTIRLVREGAPTCAMVVVAAPDQTLPALPADVLLVRDRRPEQGPLEGLAVGLRTLEPLADAAFACSCDAPLVQPSIIGALFDLLGDNEVVVARDGEHFHPLCAVYRTRLAARAERLLADGRLRPLFLIQESQSRQIDVEELRRYDRDLASFWNLNSPEAYAEALHRAGFEQPADSR